MTNHMPAPLAGHLRGRKKGGETLAAMAREFYGRVSPVVVELDRQGLSLREIGAELEKRGIRPRRINELIQLGLLKPGDSYTEGEWAAAQVRRALLRGIEAEKAKGNDGVGAGKNAESATAQIYRNIKVKAAIDAATVDRDNRTT